MRLLNWPVVRPLAEFPILMAGTFRLASQMAGWQAAVVAVIWAAQGERVASHRRRRRPDLVRLRWRSSRSRAGSSGSAGWLCGIGGEGSPRHIADPTVAVMAGVPVPVGTLRMARPQASVIVSHADGVCSRRDFVVSHARNPCIPPPESVAAPSAQSAQPRRNPAGYGTGFNCRDWSTAESIDFLN